MPKNPSNKIKKSVKRDEPMNNTMKFFLAGCVAELYLLIISRFYINADSDLKRIAWYDSYLWILVGVGAAIALVGLICAYAFRKNKKKLWLGIALAAAGVFAAGTAGLVRWNMSTLTLLIVVVPVVMILDVLWNLYDRECSVALSVLGASVIVVWVCRRMAATVLYVKAAAVVYIVLLVALLLLVKTGKLKKLLPHEADPLPVYVGCGLSAVAVAAALVSSAIAYYAMWGLAAVIFALAVYYTVKQL